MGKKYNINELLEKKKELDRQINETFGEVTPESLLFRENEVIDYTNEKNNRIVRPRERISLNEYTQKYYGLVEELAKIKCAIMKHNAETILDKLQQRERCRTTIDYYNNILSKLTIDKQFGQNITRKGENGETQEVVKSKIEPMFGKKDLEKYINNLSAEERKLNTAIQKENLNAEIEL